MKIKSIKLTNFRNHTKTDINFGDITILKGPNGAGKTNILEAIYMISVCRSYRSRRDREVIGWSLHPNTPESVSKVTPEKRCHFEPVRQAQGEKSLSDEISHARLSTIGIRDDNTEQTNTARISIDMVSNNGEKIDMALAQCGDKKVAFVKGSQVPVSLLVGRLPSVLFAPEIMQLPYDAPSRRRRYLDIFLSELEPKYLSTLVKYHKVLKARNRLLEKTYLKNIDAKEMVFWDAELSTLGKRILAARLGAVKKISDMLSANLNKINGNDRKLALKYHPTIINTDKYEEELSARLERDIKEKSTTAGPHRDDWSLIIDNNDVREASSRGEVRTIVLALKMAEMEILHQQRGERPVLLLDDVFAELDRKHSEALLDLISGAQTIITATDAEYIPSVIADKATFVSVGN